MQKAKTQEEKHNPY